MTELQWDLWAPERDNLRSYWLFALTYYWAVVLFINNTTFTAFDLIEVVLRAVVLDHVLTLVPVLAELLVNVLQLCQQKWFDSILCQLAFDPFL